MWNIWPVVRSLLSDLESYLYVTVHCYSSTAWHFRPADRANDLVSVGQGRQRCHNISISVLTQHLVPTSACPLHTPYVAEVVLLELMTTK